MYKKKSIIAIIPARSGSKRIKNKNRIIIENRPLIQWTFDSVKKSKLIDKIILSSDDHIIKNMAIKNSIEVPFMRPEHLSKNTTTADEVIIHTIDWLKKNDEMIYDYIIYLQPTSPLRTWNDIDNSIKNIINSKSKSLISAGEMLHPLEWSFNLKKMQKLFSFNKIIKRSQDLDKSYFLNGAIYIACTKFFLINKSFFSKKTLIFKMPFERSIDIDNYVDLKLTKFFLKNRNKY